MLHFPKSPHRLLTWRCFGLVLLSFVFFIQRTSFCSLEKHCDISIVQKPTALEQSQAQRNRHMCQPSPNDEYVLKRWKRLSFHLCKSKKDDHYHNYMDDDHLCEIFVSFDLCKGKEDPRICLNHSGDPGKRTNIHFVLIITDLKHCYVDKGFETLLCLITDLKQATFQGLAFASSRPNTRVRGTSTLALMICNCPAMCMLCLFYSALKDSKLASHVQIEITSPSFVKCLINSSAGNHDVSSNV